MVQNNHDVSHDQRRQHRRRFIEHRLRLTLLSIERSVSISSGKDHVTEVSAITKSAPRSIKKVQVSNEEDDLAYISQFIRCLFASHQWLEKTNIVLINNDWIVSNIQMFRVPEDVADSNVYVYDNVFSVAI